MIVILNCTAGTSQRPEESPEGLKALFEKKGLTAEIWCADPQNGMEALARRAAESDEEIIVAGGGDGTINAVAAALVNTQKTLGVLPMGTLNHFAKDLGIPQKLELAVETLTAGRPRMVDVGEVNGHVFLNNSSVGLYPRIVRHREQQRERLGRGKWPAFAWAVLSVLRVWPNLRLAIQVDGVPSITRTPFLFVGNNDYHMQGLRIGERDRLDAGQLSIYFTRDYGRLGVFALAFRSLIGRVYQSKTFETLSAQTLRVQAKKSSMDVSTDGEVRRMEMPLQYSIRPQALRVIGPAAAT